MNIISIENLDYNKILTDERIKTIKKLFSYKNIQLELDLKNEKQNLRGICTTYNGDTSNDYNIYINIIESVKDDFFYYKRRGVLGDIFNPNGKMIIPKNEYELLAYSVLFTILHEYRHYIQYQENRIPDMSYLKLSFEEYMEYRRNNLQDLEDEADDFAFSYIHHVLHNDYTCLI